MKVVILLQSPADQIIAIKYDQDVQKTLIKHIEYTASSGLEQNNNKNILIIGERFGEMFKLCNVLQATYYSSFHNLESELELISTGYSAKMLCV